MKKAGPEIKFEPMLTPKEMLELGIFGGAYFGDTLDEAKKEFPASWFKNAKLSKDGKPDYTLSYFGVKASQSLQVWQKNGWIHPSDPRGWFQWYCRYYLGRRLPGEDERQIKRWYMIRRHVAQIANKCRPGDMSCNTKQRQALLHWAYDSRKL